MSKTFRGKDKDYKKTKFLKLKENRQKRRIVEDKTTKEAKYIERY